MTKADLSKCYYLQKLIETWETEQGGSPSMDAKIQKTREQWGAERERLLDFIDTIPDARMQIILTLRHRKQWSWTKIALYLGGGNTADGVRMLHNRFLAKK